VFGVDVINTVQIAGYRGFSNFEMTELGQVNLLVGTNNSGKTSILEALYLLATGGDPSALSTIISKRGEMIERGNPRAAGEEELEVSHLFFGHELRVGSRFSITTKNQTPHKFIKFTVEEMTRDELPGLILPEGGDGLTQRLVLNIEGSPSPATPRIALSRRGGFLADFIDYPRRRRIRDNSDLLSSQYVSTESLSVYSLTALWDQIVLTDEEARVLKALKFLDPDIERIASITSKSSYRSNSSRGGFIVRRKGFDQPIPIGSLGDGTWRILALTIALIRAKDGLLLVDEIDTGLHYTVMASMWRLVEEVAKSLNVQVFATSHSYDCVQSLAVICNDENSDKSHITIQRIELNKSKAIAFSEAQIKVAAESHIEVR